MDHEPKNNLELDEEERQWKEEIEVAGNEVVDRIKQLVEESNVRRIVIYNADGKQLIEVPLAAGAVVGGLFAWFSPFMAFIGSVVALLAKVRIEIVRVDDLDDEDVVESTVTDNKKRIQIDTEDEE